jgi:YHS domain-containing protein
MRQTLVFFTLFVNTIFVTASAVAAPDDHNVHNASACALDGVALGGHDVVAYHTQNIARLGIAEISSEHGGLSYQFGSEEHQKLFELDPTKYLPHFQGWCAIALARNRLTCPDYENFKVQDGKLLLFETITFFNGQTVWNSDPVNNLISAQRNLKLLLKQ